MTDDDVLAHAPTACALVCAVHDGEAGVTHHLLAGLPPEAAAVMVLLARMVPDDKPLRELLEPDTIARGRYGIPVFADDWPPAELRDAHAAWNRRVDTPWSRAGEVEYQRRRNIRRRARKAGTEGTSEGAAA